MLDGESLDGQPPLDLESVERCFEHSLEMVNSLDLQPAISSIFKIRSNGNIQDSVRIFVREGSKVMLDS